MSELLVNKKIEPIQKPLLPRCKKCLKRHEFECKQLCDRCGRNTHETTDCFAKTHLEGHLIDD